MGFPCTDKVNPTFFHEGGQFELLITIKIILSGDSILGSTVYQQMSRPWGIFSDGVNMRFSAASMKYPVYSMLEDV
jgi:hypothetical protein